MNELFAPSLGHSTAWLVDYPSVKRRLMTFTAVATTFFHVDETNASKQLHGRRRPGLDRCASRPGRPGLPPRRPHTPL